MAAHIVITSIFAPTEAVRRFAGVSGLKLTVVGDLKTPEDWACKGARYLGVDMQRRQGRRLAGLLPWNHYSRKMLGYLEAIEQGATGIVDTDDDNIPNADWAFPRMEGTFDCTAADLGFVNVYQYFTHQPIWPRGLPLDQIRVDDRCRLATESVNCRIGVWQGLADEDPDVDAVYRLTDGRPCWFEDRSPLVLGAGTIAPFNSQNTLVRPELYALLYLPAHVTFRFTDILRGLVAQPIMALYGYRLGFTKATVVQKRNPHDYMQDFSSELPMYLKIREVLSIVADSVSVARGVMGNLHEAYRALHKADIVPQQELAVLDAWLDDVGRMSSSFPRLASAHALNP